MDHNIGPGSLNLALVLVPEPKEVGFHIDLCSGPKTIKKTNRGKRIEGAKARVFGKEAKNIQLMMKRGLLMASLVHRRSDFRNLNANRIVYPSRRENLESKVFNALEEELEGGKVNLSEKEDVIQSGSDDRIPSEFLGPIIGDVNGNIVVWNVDKEISKVIETGLALGCDFGGSEEQIRI
ncbi:hypothetical protein Q3G72_027612 [Acer saccharum]|nr:hypothetical protein Q3G72_027612 [Acer saccharum]